MNVNLRALALLLVPAPTIFAQAPFNVVSAASYQSVIAPESIATIFGSNLARSTASATLDANGQLPTELVFTRVEVDGKAASLFYVSPGQINFVVPAGVGPGTSTVVIRSTDTGATRPASVQVAQSVPAIFSSDASGAGPGAILNAVTFQRAPFLTVTPENGPDTRTRLAIYATGLRNAKSVSAQALDAQQNRYDLTVEFAGAAPGYFGLDQVNVVVPPDLDGAGVVNLTLNADGAGSNTVTFEMARLAPSLLQLAAVTLSPSVVNGGDSMTATIFLNGVARAGGFPVSLRTTNLAATVAGQVIVPEGKASVQTAVSTSSVTNPQTGSLQAQAQGVIAVANFEIDPANTAQLDSITTASSSVLGGRTLSAVVTLTAPAPPSGVTVSLSSDSPALKVPATVTVLFNQTAANFTITTSAVTSQVIANVVASANRTSVSAKVTVLPVLSISLQQSSVVGGSTVNGTVALGDVAPAGGTVVMLASSNGVAQVLPLVTVPAGSQTQQFTVNTSTTATSQTVTLTATYQGVTQTATLNVTPPSAPTLTNLTISPNPVSGGSAAQGVVTLAAPAGLGGEQVTLQTDRFLIAQVPNFVVVPQGATSATFTIQTTPVFSPQAVAISATKGGVTKTVVLTVQ